MNSAQCLAAGRSSVIHSRSACVIHSSPERLSAADIHSVFSPHDNSAFLYLNSYISALRIKDNLLFNQGSQGSAELQKSV